MEIDTEIPEWIIELKRMLKERGIKVKDLIGKEKIRLT
jgi:hypothetical protein